MSKETIYDEMIEDKNFERLMAQEDLILEVTEAFCSILEAENVKRNALAEMLGKTKGFVSQVLNGGRNLTLRTMADIAFSLGYSVEFNFVKKDRDNKKDTIKMSWEINQEPILSFKRLNIPDDYSPPTCDLQNVRIAI